MAQLPSCLVLMKIQQALESTGSSAQPPRILGVLISHATLMLD